MLASTAGAVTVVTAASDSNVTDLLADEWVTHAFLANARAEALDLEELEDLEVLVLTRRWTLRRGARTSGGSLPTRTRGRCEAIMMVCPGRCRCEE
ncbi:hypothetical protein GS540_09930 [Rhodococcus hoagii]|nr:hypothetical protein [Prescottella equi]